MSAPQIIAGPAVIQFGGNSYYSEGDITLNLNRETFNVVTAMGGKIDERLVAQMVEVKFKCAGALDTVAKYLPYVVASIGKLLINQASPTPLTIWGLDGVKNIWSNAFISALPKFTLAANKSALGDMTITALGDPTKTLVDAAAWNTISSAALTDATFDDTKLVTSAYTAAWGGSPFASMVAEDDFSFEPVIGIAMKKVANYGNVNAMLTDLTVGCRFKPANLTEAQMWTLLNLQGSGAIQPGMSVSGGSTSLVITGGTATFTMPNAGPKSAATAYGLAPLRQGEVLFVNRKTWTAGVVNAPLTIAFS